MLFALASENEQNILPPIPYVKMKKEIFHEQYIAPSGGFTMQRLHKNLKYYINSLSPQLHE